VSCFGIPPTELKFTFIRKRCKWFLQSRNKDHESIYLYEFLKLDMDFEIFRGSRLLKNIYEKAVLDDRD